MTCDREQIESIVLESVRVGERIGQVMDSRGYTDEYVDELERLEAWRAAGKIMDALVAVWEGEES